MAHRGGSVLSAPGRLEVVGLLAVPLAGVLGVAVWTWQGAWRGQGSEDDRPLEGLKIFGRVPEFSLIERSGRRITPAKIV